MKICPCGTAFCNSICPVFCVVVATFPVSLSSQLTFFWDSSLESCRRAGLCALWRSDRWEFHTFRIVGCPSVVHVLGSQRFLVSLGLLFRHHTPPVSSCLWGCQKGTEVWQPTCRAASAAPGREGNADRVSLLCVNVSFAICERNLHFPLERKSFFIISECFGKTTISEVHNPVWL